MNDFTTWPPLFVVDVEGNGANPPDLVEVAALPVRHGQPDTTTAGHWLIQPPRPVTSFAARVHGITDQQLADQPRWETVAPQVHGLLGEAWICAHHAHVDYQALARHLPDWRPAGVIDTLRLARATYPDAPRHTLDALLTHTGIDLTHAPAQRHRATFDAYATAHLLLAMATHYDDWDALRAAAVPPGLPGDRQPTEDAPGLW
ncbi:DNA polymerase-3 subunit epsilon/exodeoxyribonuclease X [Streptomyces zhaozhouensis]|uniref:DNA polymerase-3 subunit epsilon/exodeoxyribonuclease X n=1 Tax=Streptomyces zhaozhouensis TaxID=1300267 RepID=A0A286EA76_9ACTN|nr:3'-5' exonuclease [Streptomyces zhaozhouensis]SOD67845.1 DNA polymerase-3 subunit epsilon/exodeoxyribonuclease X [Streptomyces zhaozhouensis]